VGDVVKLHAERWVEIFLEDGLCVEISTKGRVRFFTESFEHGATIGMEQMMRLGKALALAYSGEEGDDHEEQPDPAV